MAIDILAFGIAKDIFGKAAITLQADETLTAAQLREKLEAQYPELKKLATYMIAVNNEYAGPATLIHPGDEVAIIPPVSGG